MDTKKDLLVLLKAQELLNSLLQVHFGGYPLSRAESAINLIQLEIYHGFVYDHQLKRKLYYFECDTIKPELLLIRGRYRVTENCFVVEKMYKEQLTYDEFIARFLMISGTEKAVRNAKRARK